MSYIEKQIKGNHYFFVPIIVEKNIISKYHDELGHQGANKVYDSVQQNYWFPKMKTKITEHIANCCKCIAFSPTSGKIRYHRYPGRIKETCIGRGGVVTKFAKLYPTKTTTS